MSGLSHRTLSINGISMRVAEEGTGPPVILCHGFPELWYSWRHQLPALAGAGYRAVAPDQRGYGGTDRPEHVDAYDMVHLTGDLLGLLDVLGEERAVFVGHDWGAIVAWNLAVMAPERVAAVVGMSVPFVPRTPARPTEVFELLAGGRFLYLLYFQEVGPADRELAEDPRRTITATLWSASGDASPGSMRWVPREGTRYLDGLSEPSELPGWLSEEDLAVYVDAFGRTGFTGALSWYRNMDRNWELGHPPVQGRVTVPALFVAGERDPVLKMAPPQIMEGWVDDLRGTVILPGAGHWIQQERPREVNEALIAFLRGLR